MKSLFKKSKEAARDTAAVAGAGEETILIVDDSPTELHVLRGILEKAGYQVEVAVDGEQGVAAAKELLPDLILMDVVMPNLNGFQATRQLRNEETTSGIPVIMVTTKDQETDRSWGLRQGAEEYLVKPVSGSELLEKIEKLISN